MDVGAIDDGKAGIVVGKGEEEIGAAQHDRLGAARTEPAALLEEDLALRFGDVADCGHGDVGVVHPVEGGALCRHHLDRGNAAVEMCLHHDTRAEDADLPQPALRQCRVDRGNGVQHGQGRDRRQLLHAEMAAHRGDDGGFCAGALHALHEAREYLGLPGRISGHEIAAHLAHVGMRHG